ncbi:MAG: TolC family protein [Lutibacter sp.]|nr:TolC family protein [Lutibacter sp.]
MNTKFLYMLSFVLLFITNSKAQENIDKVLLEIAKNNKSINANNQFLEASKLKYKTGLTLENPKVEYEYLNGSSDVVGNQKEFYIVQSFDFPTAYLKKRQISEKQIAQIHFKSTAYKQEILLQAKQYCIELIYLNKKQVELKVRFLNADKLYKGYQKKLKNGDASMLDLNKAKLQLLMIENEVRTNASLINQFNQKLQEMNGGIPLNFSDLNYPLISNIPDFQSLISVLKGRDPVLKSFLKQQEINSKQVELSKALGLPKMEAGYRSQELLGQKLQGVHLGITLPLWENKNKVKHQKAAVVYSELQVDRHQTAYYSQMRQLYTKYERLSSSLKDYKQLLATSRNKILLDKALKLGSISTIEYFMEISYFYNSIDKYLQLEKEYHQVIASLYKYKL